MRCQRGGGTSSGGRGGGGPTAPSATAERASRTQSRARVRWGVADSESRPPALSAAKVSKTSSSSSISPDTYARPRPSSPGAHSRRRSARGVRTTSVGAPGGPASEPSQARTRTGSAGTPRTALAASDSRSAAPGAPAMSSSPAPSARRVASRRPGSMAHSGRRGGFLIFVDDRHRGDPVDGEGAVLAAPLVVALQEAADQRHRLDDALAAAALGVDVAQPDRAALAHGPRQQLQGRGGRHAGNLAHRL